MKKEFEQRDMEGSHYKTFSDFGQDDLNFDEHVINVLESPWKCDNVRHIY